MLHLLPVLRKTTTGRGREPHPRRDLADGRSDCSAGLPRHGYKRATMAPGWDDRVANGVGRRAGARR